MAFKDPKKARAYKAAWARKAYAANPEKFRQIQQDTYYADAEKAREISRKWYTNNLEEARARLRRSYRKHATQRNLYSKQYKATHQKILKLIRQRRRAREKHLPYTFTEEQYDFMLQYWAYACAICGNQEGFEWTLGLDHWIPLASPACPGTVAENMLPLCDGKGGCNTSKRHADGRAWLHRRYGTRKATSILRKIQQYFILVREQGQTLSA